MPGGGILPQAGKDLVAVLIRQHDIQDHKVRDRLVNG